MCIYEQCVRIWCVDTKNIINQTHQVMLPVECFDSAQQLLVVAAVDKNLCVVLYRLGEH